MKIADSLAMAARFSMRTALIRRATALGTVRRLCTTPPNKPPQPERVSLAQAVRGNFNQKPGDPNYEALSYRLLKPIFSLLGNFGPRSLLSNRLFIFGLAGFLLGGGGASGYAIMQWNTDAARPPNETPEERKRRKANEKLAAKADAAASCSGIIKQYGTLELLPLFSSWKTVEAEVRNGLLLLRSAAADAASASTAVSFDRGKRCSALPLAGAKAVMDTAKQAEEEARGQFEITVTTPSGETERLMLFSKEARDKWMKAIEGTPLVNRRRVVEVTYPASWEEPLEVPRLVPLVKGSKEYVYVEQLALRQQYQGKGWVKGKMKVNGIQRVQSPHIWEQYAMRRSIIAAENGGDSAERMLWHGTTKSDLIIKYGFDPRVCSMKGMFGGGVYYADKSTKSVRYAGAHTVGDKGELFLCRASLGHPMVKRQAQQDMRRPPDPLPLFGWEHFTMWMKGHKFHSVFAPAGVFPSMLLMNEYIVYHTNQGYPEYLIDFELV